MDKITFGMIAFRLQNRQVIQRNFLPATAVPMPVGNQIMGDAIQPRGKGNAAVCVGFDVIHRPLKDASSQILRIVEVTRPVVYIVEDSVYITLIEQTKSIAVTL